MSEQLPQFQCAEHSGIKMKIESIETDIAEIKTDLKSVMKEALRRVPYPIVFLISGLGMLAIGLAVAWLTRG